MAAGGGDVASCASLGSVGLMKALVGSSWISVLLLRRRLFSILDLMFAAAAPEDHCSIIRLSGKLKSEFGIGWR